MKSTAVTLLASLLFEILAPGFSYASRKPQAEKTDGVARPPSGYRTGNKPDAGPEALEEVAAKAIRLFYEMEVRTMSRGQLDVHRLKKGLVAHVIYTSPDGADALTGDRGKGFGRYFDKTDGRYEGKSESKLCRYRHNCRCQEQASAGEVAKANAGRSCHNVTGQSRHVEAKEGLACVRSLLVQR